MAVDSDTAAHLPDLPSQLLRLALNDLHTCEEDGRYEIDMYTYHWWNGKNDRCHVCLAGAVMAQSLRDDILNDSAPFDFGIHADKLKALDRFRRGMIRSGVSLMGLELPDTFVHIAIPEYSFEGREEFHSRINMLATWLEEAGL